MTQTHSLIPFIQAFEILDSKRIPLNKATRSKMPGDIPYYGATGLVDYINDFIFDEELILLGEDAAPFLDPTKPVAYRIQGKSWVNNHAHVLRAREGYLAKYLMHALNLVDYSDLVSGTTRLKLTQGAMRKIQIPHRSPDQQQAIVDEIETQFARLDDAEAALRRSEVRLKKLEAAQRELVFTSGEGATWPIQTMKSLITNIEAGKSYKCEERPPEQGETGIVKVSAVTWEEFDELESKTCLDESRVDERLLIEPGQFLFSRANTVELVGRAVITAAVTRRLMLSDKIWRVTFNDYVDPRWVLYFLRSYSGRQQIESRATGNQLSMRNISQNNFKAISLPVPDRSIQSERITTLETALEKIERQSSAVSISLRRINHLRQAILKNAFEGTNGQ